MISFLQKYWWAIALAALAGWAIALSYFTVWPPQTAMERDIRLRAEFLEPRRAADLDGAAELLKVVNTHIRLLPADQLEYRYIRDLLDAIEKGRAEIAALREELLRADRENPAGDHGELLRKTAESLALKDADRPKNLKDAVAALQKRSEEIEDGWIEQAMTILVLDRPDRPAGLDEAVTLLKDRRVRIETENKLLPSEKRQYRSIVRLLAEAASCESEAYRRKLLARLRATKPEAQWKDIEDGLVREAADALSLAGDARPASLKDAAEKLRTRRAALENSLGFNGTLDGLLVDLKGRRDRDELLKKVNDFLARDVVEMAEERLRLAGTPALPFLVRLLEEKGETRARLYDVILHIIAATRLQSLTGDIDGQIETEKESLRARYGDRPDASSVAKLNEWLNSPGNRELVGK